MYLPSSADASTTESFDTTLLSNATNKYSVHLRGESNDGLSHTTTSPMYRSNIPSLVASVMASMTTGGTTYAFGLYAGSALKRTLHLSPSEIDTVSTAFFFAGLFSWIPGLFADRVGARFSIAAGGVLGAMTLVSYWLVATTRVSLPHRSWIVPVLSSLAILIFLSNALITGSVFKTIVMICGPGTKGSAVGAAKGYVGLGSGAYAVIFESIRLPGQSNLDFLPMAAVFSIMCATLPAILLLPSRQQSQSDIFIDEASHLHFRTLFVSLSVLASLVIGNSLMELFFRGDKHSSGSATDDVYALNETMATRTSIQDFPSKFGDDNDSGRHFFMAFLLVAVWLGPILGLLFLPRRRTMDVFMVPQEDDIGIINENNNFVDSTEDHFEMESTTDRFDEEVAPLPSRSGLGSSPKSKASLSALSRKKQTEKIPRLLDSVSTQRRGSFGSRSSTRQEEDTLLLEENVDYPNNLGISSSATRVASPASAGRTAFVPNNVEENFNLVQMLKTPSALLMLWTTTILVGAGTVETNNMGEMVEALGFNENVASASLALFSVAQSGSRVVSGALSEVAMNWNGITGYCWIEHGIPRPFFLVVASCVGFFAHFLLGVATNQGVFVVGSTLAGVAFGMVWPLMVLIVGEVFGSAHSGANYLFYDGFTSAIGTLLLTKVLAQAVYEDHIPADAEDRNVCFGADCFRLTHLIVSVLSFTCIATSVAMMYTSRRIYNKRALHTA